MQNLVGSAIKARRLPYPVRAGGASKRAFFARAVAVSHGGARGSRRLQSPGRIEAWFDDVVPTPHKP
jgi:hypothetical protein